MLATAEQPLPVGSRTMNPRDRIRTALERRPPDHLPMWETTIWPQTLERWHTEGLPADVTLENRDRLDDYFELDPLACINDLFDPSFGLPPHTLEETTEHRVYVDCLRQDHQRMERRSGSADDG